MLFGSIQVLDPAGKELAGEIEVSNRETIWSFKPNLPWPTGLLKLKVTPDLEDSAGNSIDRPFDVDLLKEVTSSEKASAIELEFHIK